jgi:protein gp37
MSDLFHKKIPQQFIDSAFDTMEKADWHTFQILTKRSSLMRSFVARRYRDRLVPPHIWLGVSVENKQAAARIRHLQGTKATIRFLSFEPLIEDIGPIDLTGIHWVIVGGESGPNARPMNSEWAERIRDLCIAHSIPFFFKQWGAWSANGKKGAKSANGRSLGGRTWDELPSPFGETISA